MKSIFCTSFAAPIGYYQAYVKSEILLLEMHEHFIKQTIRNRCEIATSNGRLMMTIPLSNRKNNMQVKEVLICYKTDWQRQQIKTLETAYKSSPFFEFYIDDLLAIYQQKPTHLVAWNDMIHQQILKWLKVNKSFEHTLVFEKTYENMNDFREKNWAHQPLKSYHQVFENKLGFMGNLSILDLLFNCGNETLYYLNNLTQ